jgi:phosphatidylserine/phosphatidylglycerophosphate/cardiolipin synthase-like enzyme
MKHHRAPRAGGSTLVIRQVIPLVFLLAVLGPALLTHAETTDGEIELVESVPVETELGLPDLRDTPVVWREMIAEARQSIAIGAFYLSARPDAPGALEPILQVLGQAAGRGVQLQVLSDAGFYRTYPEVVDRLAALPGAEARQLDARTLWGGVLHAKYLLVDDREFFVGSQNWDWRALEHIRELGVRIRSPALAEQLARIFALDWALAAGETPSAAAAPGAEGPESSSQPGGGVALSYHGNPVTTRLAASPPQALPEGIPWDEPLLVETIDAARDTLRLQLLTYSPRDRDGSYYDVLDTALRRAAARGVVVRIVLANWAKRRSMLPWVQSLAAVPGIAVRFSNLPEWSGGHIPYARVEHAKYLAADRTASWVGTSNWSRDYFHDSRNLSIFVKGEAFAADLIRFFERGWNAPHMEPVDPCRDYAPPRIGD